MNELNRIISNSDGRTQADNLRMLYSDEDLKTMGLFEKLKKADETRKEDISEQVDWDINIETKKEKEERIKKEFEGEFEVVSPDGEVITLKNEW